MKFLFGKKKPIVTNDAYAPHEEIDSKRTSKLGYFFLILMVIFGITQGNSLLFSIQESVGQPVPNVNCTDTLAEYAQIEIGHSYKTNSYDHWSYPLNDSPGFCAFTDREVRLGLDVAYNEVATELNTLRALETSISSLEDNLSREGYLRNQNIDEYQAALIEDVAERTDVNGNVLDTVSIGSAVSTGAERIRLLEQELQVAQNEKEQLVAVITQHSMTYRDALTEAYAQYESEVRVNELIIFLISIILIFPLFYLSWRKYSNSRENRSEYAIIWGGVVATFGFMVAQVLLVFIYEILPKQIIGSLLVLFSDFILLWTLLYYLGFLLIPAFFGSLIYLIQKKFYNKKAVAMRALKSGHCPQCSLKVLPTMNNCPICGYHLKTKCEHCNHMSTSGGSFCEVCGEKRSEQIT